MRRRALNLLPLLLPVPAPHATRAGVLSLGAIVLRELGGNPEVRDPDRYCFSLFGERPRARPAFPA